MFSLIIRVSSPPTSKFTTVQTKEDSEENARTSTDTIVAQEYTGKETRPRGHHREEDIPVVYLIRRYRSKIEQVGKFLE